MSKYRAEVTGVGGARSMRTTVDTLTGKRFRWNTTVRVHGIVCPAREGEHTFTWLHPDRVPDRLLRQLNQEVVK